MRKIVKSWGKIPESEQSIVAMHTFWTTKQQKKRKWATAPWNRTITNESGQSLPWKWATTPSKEDMQKQANLGESTLNSAKAHETGQKQCGSTGSMR
jgi:hypothetical protein